VFQVAALPFSISTAFTKIWIIEDSNVGVAVTVFVALVVLAVYSCTELSNVGDRVNDPITSSNKVATTGLLLF